MVSGSNPSGNKPDEKDIVFNQDGQLTISDDFSGQIFGFMNEVASNQARQDLELSIQDWDHEDGFIDIFWNLDKVSDSSNVNISTGASGNVTLSSDLDTVESGDTEQNWESLTGFSIDTNSEINGSNSLEVKNGETASKDLITPLDSDGDKWVGKLKIDNQTSSGDTGFILRKSSNTNTFWLKFNDGGNVQESLSGTEILPSWSAGTVYNIEIVFDFTNNEADIDINGNTVQNIPLGNNSSQIATVFLRNYNASETRNAYWDDFTFRGTNGGAIPDNGSLTHVRKELDLNGSDPSSIQADPEYKLNGQNLELVLSDNSGNSVTLQPSDFGTEIDTSSFQDRNIQAKWNLISDGSDTPKIQKTIFTGVK